MESSSLQFTESNVLNKSPFFILFPEKGIMTIRQLSEKDSTIQSPIRASELQVHEILGADIIDGDLQFLLEFKHPEEFLYVPADIVNKKYTTLVLVFLIERVVFRGDPIPRGLREIVELVPLPENMSYQTLGEHELSNFQFDSILAATRNGEDILFLIRGKDSYQLFFVEAPVLFNHHPIEVLHFFEQRLKFIIS